MAAYPDSIKTWTNVQDNITTVSASHVNEAYAEIIATQTELDRVKEAFLNVKLLGAIGDGTTDDTAAIQAAIDAAAINGGIVFVPEGSYAITGLELKAGVKLTGVNYQSLGREGDTTEKGTWFYCTSTTVPAITMASETALENVVFWYPNQITTGTNFIVYPATIHTIWSLKAALIRNVSGINPWIFIDGSLPHTQLTIENVTAFPIYIGLKLDNSYDVDRIYNVHFHTSYTQVTPTVISRYDGYCFANTRAFVIGRLDWAAFNNCFAFGHQVGFEFSNLGNGVPGQITLQGCGADACKFPFAINNGWGIRLTDCDATSYDIENPSVDTESPAVLIKTSGVMVQNLNVWGSNSHGIVIEGSSGNVVRNVSVVGSHILGYGNLSTISNNRAGIQVALNCEKITLQGNHIDGKNKPYARGIYVWGNNAAGQLLMTDNIIHNTGLQGVYLAGAVDVILTHNILKNCVLGLVDDLGAISKIVNNNIVS